MMARASLMHMLSSREENKTRPAGLKGQSEVMTPDLSVLKNGAK